ncbi:hypothetical protein A9Z40_03130 [Microbacterium arborescens]|uniref:Tail terminator n=1 Tax=Microbacterium arborescens TaxID=33883 RepID=A0ABX2WIF1_9MICO|nr:hypothetical protein [Microbacterium arborescens]OAZ40948.1 hypothetical protein A9Z40_03130 [Microbacterium arborescens]
MAEVLIPADDEAALVRELSDRMDVHVGTRIPNPRPAEFIRVVGTGGTARDLVTDQPVLDIEGFAETEGAARYLTAAAIGHAQAAGRAGSLGGVTCYGVTAVSLPANLPMPSVPTHFRYTAKIQPDLRRVRA